jgi:cytochrome c peroxidase
MRVNLGIMCAVLIAGGFSASAQGDTSVVAAGGTAREVVHVIEASAAVHLGQSLFFDLALSADGDVSCATCHQPSLAFSDGLPRASGTRAQQGTRNTPSLLDVAAQRSLFWDGRRSRLEDQALDPLFNHREHGLRDEAELLGRLRADPGHVAAFQAAFGVSADQIATQHVAQALAAYQRTLVSGPSPFDRFRAGQADALPPAARRGWIVFDQQARCTRCHSADAADGGRPLFTDHQFHSLAVGFGKIERKLPQLTQRLVALHRDGRAFSQEVLADADIAELGRFAYTLDPRDLGAFKTPGLRNVAATAPYMHDGSVPTLAEAVDLEVYYRGARDDRPLILTPAEREDLITFLQALTSDDVTPPLPRDDAPTPQGQPPGPSHSRP